MKLSSTAGTAIGKKSVDCELIAINLGSVTVLATGKKRMRN